MNDFENYPLAPFINALRTVVGRAGLVIAAFILGVLVGGISAERAFSGAWDALTSFPAWSAFSFFFGVGFVAFPAALIFSIMFIRSEWPLWTVFAVTLLVWWNFHKTIHWAEHDSPAIRIEQQVQAAAEEAAKRASQPSKASDERK